MPRFNHIYKIIVRLGNNVRQRERMEKIDTIDFISACVRIENQLFQKHFTVYLFSMAEYYSNVPHTHTNLHKHTR